MQNFALILSQALAGDVRLQLDGFEVICRQSDGYVNATALCKAGGTELSRWNERGKKEPFLLELAGSLEISRDLLTKAITTGPNNGRGTWVHPQVAISIATWISPRFEVRVSSWIHELIVFGNVRYGLERGVEEVMREQMAQMQRTIDEKDGIISSQRGNISQLEQDIEDIKRELRETLLNSRTLITEVTGTRRELAGMGSELTEARRELAETNDSLQFTQELLVEVADRAVPAVINTDKKEVFLLFRVTDNEQGYKRFSMHGVQQSNRTVPERLIARRYGHSFSSPVLSLEYAPNSILLKEATRELAKRTRKFSVSSCLITLSTPPFGEQELIDEIRRVYEERY